MATLSRRIVIRSATLGSMAWLLAHAAGHWPMQGTSGLALSATARTTLVATLEALLPVGAPAEDVAADVDRFLAAGDPDQAKDLAMALLVLEHTGGAAPLSFRRFSRLSREQRIAVIEAWQRSSVGVRRQIADALRRLAAFSWYSRPEVWPSIGYDGPWVGR